jgi:hypothetical protein
MARGWASRDEHVAMAVLRWVSRGGIVAGYGGLKGPAERGFVKQRLGMKGCLCRHRTARENQTRRYLSLLILNVRLLPDMIQQRA